MDFLAALLNGLCQPVITTDPQSQTNIDAVGAGPFFYRVWVQE